MPASRNLTIDSTAAYRIRVQGYLDTTWSDRMNGVAISVKSMPDKTSITELTGEFQDQAAVSGVLNTLYDLGLPLLSVECLSIKPDTTGQTHPDA